MHLMCSLIIQAIYVSIIIVWIFDNSTFVEKQDLPISIPEEIQAGSVGDTLLIEKVSDSIYIGFKNQNYEKSRL